ncbi:MAG: hypothetical protein ACYTGI_16580 [Planctomycetota bacterium]|jgi:hypothetical protein
MVTRVTAWLGLVAAAALAGPDETHTASVATKHFTIHYRPGSRAGAGVDRVAVMAERDLQRICTQLKIPVDGRFRLYLYDDVPELRAITGRSGVGGYSAIDASHIPFDDDQTRFHEMVHIVAYRLPKSGEEARGFFHFDGLANALLEFVHGVHVHAVATFYRRERKLPALREMTGENFYVWLKKHPGFQGYDVAASWMRFLIDTYGMDRFKRYYTGTPTEKAFGTGMAKLEAAWHEVLDGYVLRPEVETLLRRRHREPAEFDRFPLTVEERLPKEIVGEPDDWKDLDAASLRPERAADWARDGKVLRGRNATPQWSWCALGKRRYGSCAVQAVIRPAAGSLGVALRVGDKVQALLVQNGVFHYRKDLSVKSTNQEILGARPKVHLLLVRRGAEMQVWLDGALVLTSRADKRAAPIAVGVAGGAASFEDVAVRALRP